MNRFEGVRFRGTFRSYQQRVLDNAKQYLADGKVNIVAAPGSGKTILGLELIRKLGQPCLILSPTATIREQWGQRFRELFVEDESRFEELFSTNLHEVKLVNSSTYQDLYMEMERIVINDNGRKTHGAFNLSKTIRKYEIKTICLYEAHHLKEEWQQTLEKLKEFLPSDAKIISLTDTHPYDLEGAEWKSYYDICGDIDDEIYVPELVAQGMLCSHQDYVYFNYPTQKDPALLEYGEHVRSTVAEVGKLESIGDIAEHEYQTMGKDLRMLVITDYIRNDKENLSKIGTDESFGTINTFSIFETLRRRNDTLNMGVLSKELIILPQSIELQGIMMTKEPISGTRYCIVDMAGATYEAVDFISQLLREGKIQILIGINSLLGEGWDESCINSLILASFEDSYISTNQMRGCAIRMDKDNPKKSTNIWHLVTLEPGNLATEIDLVCLEAKTGMEAAPEEPKPYLQLEDLEVVKRRFDSFMGPNYETGEIESGISRVTLLQSPFDVNGITRINREMLKLSEDREAMHEMWKSQLEGRKFNVVVEASIPSERAVPPFSYMDKISFFVYIMIPIYAYMMVPIVNKLIQVIGMGGNVSLVVELFLFFLFFSAAVFVPVGMVTRRLFQHLTPVRSIKTMGKVLAKTLTECGFISPGGEVHVEKRYFSGREIGVQLRNATMHDQNTFNRALAEMLSPIEEPHFLLVRKKSSLLNYSKYRYQQEYSFACPTVLGRKRKHAEVLARHMKKSLGDMAVIKPNHWFSEECSEKSFVSVSPDKLLLPRANGKYIVTREENFHE